MTVLSLQWLVARPRRRAALIRTSNPARRPGAPRHLRSPRHRERRTYPDSFFADPAAVEDDSRRMMHLGRRP